MDGGKAVADPFGSDIEGPPDTLRANRFPGMGGQVEDPASGGCLGVELAEGGCAGVVLVTPDADSDDRRVVSPHFCCLAEDPRRRSGSELADCVKYPICPRCRSRPLPARGHFPFQQTAARTSLLSP